MTQTNNSTYKLKCPNIHYHSTVTLPSRTFLHHIFLRAVIATPFSILTLVAIVVA